MSLISVRIGTGASSVKFAGDTTVLILDNVRAGPGKANWSARIMFHDDVYAGRW